MSLRRGVSLFVGLGGPTLEGPPVPTVPGGLGLEPARRQGRRWRPPAWRRGRGRGRGWHGARRFGHFARGGGAPDPTPSPLLAPFSPCPPFPLAPPAKDGGGTKGVAGDPRRRGWLPSSASETLGACIGRPSPRLKGGALGGGATSFEGPGGQGGGSGPDDEPGRRGPGLRGRGGAALGRDRRLDPPRRGLPSLPPHRLLRRPRPPFDSDAPPRTPTPRRGGAPLHPGPREAD